jgi:uncharacterized protein
LEEIVFEARGRRLYGSVFPPRQVGESPHPRPGILFAHGLGSDQKGYRTRAQVATRELDVACLTFDFSGHGQHALPGELEVLTPEDHLIDLSAAYDELARLSFVETTKIGVCAASYGAYIATLLTREKQVARLLLRAPAMYGDNDFRRPLAPGRNSRASASASMLTTSLAAFKGEVLILESGADDTIPPEVIAAYRVACPKAQHQVIADAAHRLTDPKWQEQFLQAIIDFFGKL